MFSLCAAALAGSRFVPQVPAHGDLVRVAEDGRIGVVVDREASVVAAVDPATGAIHGRLSLPVRVDGAAVSRHGAWVVFWSEARVVGAWDLANDRWVDPPPQDLGSNAAVEETVHDAAFSPDERRVALTRDRFMEPTVAEIWDLTGSGALVSVTLDGPECDDPPDPIWGAEGAFVDLLACDGTAWRVDPATGEAALVDLPAEPAAGGAGRESDLVVDPEADGRFEIDRGWMRWRHDGERWTQWAFDAARGVLLPLTDVPGAWTYEAKAGGWVGGSGVCRADVMETLIAVPPTSSPDGRSLAALVGGASARVLVWDASCGDARDFAAPPGADDVRWLGSDRLLISTFPEEGVAPELVVLSARDGATLASHELALHDPSVVWGGASQVGSTSVVVRCGLPEEQGVAAVDPPGRSSEPTNTWGACGAWDLDSGRVSWTALGEPVSAASSGPDPLVLFRRTTATGERRRRVADVYEVRRVSDGVAVAEVEGSYSTFDDWRFTPDGRWLVHSASVLDVRGRILDPRIGADVGRGPGEGVPILSLPGGRLGWPDGEVVRGVDPATGAGFELWALWADGTAHVLGLGPDGPFLGDRTALRALGVRAGVDVRSAITPYGSRRVPRKAESPFDP